MQCSIARSNNAQIASPGFPAGGKHSSSAAWSTDCTPFFLRQFQQESKVTGLSSPQLEHFQHSLRAFRALTKRAGKLRTLSWYASAEMQPVFSSRVSSALCASIDSSDGSTLISYPHTEHLKSSM